ncbi:Kelch-type beta propeller [Arabidopsis thaliana x Arabidopsis arenosa]|uniref:Kelch-type beta propeller n=1 Tax=Arabidopsis thaliana x Arabidopsis arenosa TaxID=1240361 RepID=A0A8T1YD91_9BRAS|nr:Kelch-type beta propeller [Arabidopsis thaliana x Arabidopsis arenosa]
MNTHFTTATSSSPNSQFTISRAHIGTTEPCLYLCLKLRYDSSDPQWFTLWMKPDENLTSNGETMHDYSLIQLPSSSYSPPVPYRKSTIAVGSEIYLIGGLPEAPSSSVRILDCRIHTWRDAPNMTLARSEPMAVYLDEKIYVMGGCKNDESANWLEVFDIKTQTWRALPSPRTDHELRCKYIKVNPNAFKGKLYVAAETKDYTYEPKDGTWNVVREKSIFKDIIDWCVIEDVMYSCTYSGSLLWYDSEGREWREIKGLDVFNVCLTWYFKKMHVHGIVNYVGKLVVVWRQWYNEDGKGPKTKVGFSKIALENRHKDIWGKTEWVNTVLEIPKSYYTLTCVDV